MQIGQCHVSKLGKIIIRYNEIEANLIKLTPNEVRSTEALLF